MLETWVAIYNLVISTVAANVNGASIFQDN